MILQKLTLTSFIWALKLALAWEHDFVGKQALVVKGGVLTSREYWMMLFKL